MHRPSFFLSQQPITKQFFTEQKVNEIAGIVGIKPSW